MSSGWIQRGIDIDGEAAGDQSGFRVSMSADGTIVAIGAYVNSGYTGHVRVYAWNGSAWVQRGSDIDGEAIDNNSGVVSLSANGSVVAIGAQWNSGNGFGSGHVRIYAWTGSAWVQRGLDIDGEATSNNAGTSVSLSADGSIVAIGAPYNNDNGQSSGHVRVYTWNGSAWVQRGTDIDGKAAYDNAGISVSLSADGSIIAIGASAYENGMRPGQVRVYVWNGSEWVQRGLDMNSEALNDNNGHSVSLSANGSIVATGAIRNSGNGVDSGHVRVFEWNGVAWVQRGTDIDGEAAGDESGFSVSLSADGSIVAIGANKNNGNGIRSGHVRIYAWNTTTSAWVQRGLDINGEAAGDDSGFSVSLSADGSIVAVGAPRNDGSGFNAGHVRVYTYTPPSADSVVTTIQNYINGSGTTSLATFKEQINTLRTQLTPTIVSVPNIDASTLYNTLSAGASLANKSVRVLMVPNGGTLTVPTDPSENIVHIPGSPGESFTLVFGGTPRTVAFDASGTLTVDGTAYGLGETVFLDRYYKVVAKGSAALEPIAPPVTPSVVPCFFGNARVQTPSGYCRMDSLKVGDKVVTPKGASVIIENVKVTKCPAGPNTNPYVIPAGCYGATHRVLISPDHKVCLPDGRRVEAKRLGLVQEAREGELTYYNLELAGQADMVVSGVPVESLAHVRRVVMSLAAFEATLKARYGTLTPATLANIKRTCRLVGRDAVEVPVMRR